MRIFLYEFITGGGMFSVSPPDLPSGSLLREGSAMFNSVAEDLSRIPNAEVVGIRDSRLTQDSIPEIEYQVVTSAEEESRRFDSLAASADWTLVIAPEFDEILLHRTRRVEELGGRLLGPNSSTVALGTYKDRTVAHLKSHGIRTTTGLTFSVGSPVPDSISYPAVLKPIDGAGSQGMRLIKAKENFPKLFRGTFRLEEFQSGIPVSAAVLCGPNLRIGLPACQQYLSPDGSFAYLGGKVPLEREFGIRAERLASRVAESLPDCRGYIGVDIVLGPSVEWDAVIELNPRLTTSYVGLRQLANCNLAAAMLELARGESPELCFHAGTVEFRADGVVTNA